MKNLILTPMLLPTEEAQIPFLCIVQSPKVELEYWTELYRMGCQRQHLYLCSTLPIKEGDHKYCSFTNSVTKYDLLAIIPGTGTCEDCKKIEFTTDQKLISDGVPAIDGNTKVFIKCVACEGDDVHYCTECDDKEEKEVNFLSEYCKRYNQKDNQKGVDVEKLANELYQWSDPHIEGDITRSDCKLLVEWFKIKLQSNAGGFSLEDMLYIVRHTIKQWSSLNEQREKDHKQLVDNWIDNDLKLLIQSFKEQSKRIVPSSTPSTAHFGDDLIYKEVEEQPKGDIIIELNNGQIYFK